MFSILTRRGSVPHVQQRVPPGRPRTWAYSMWNGAIGTTTRGICLRGRILIVTTKWVCAALIVFRQCPVGIISARQHWVAAWSKILITCPGIQFSSVQSLSRVWLFVTPRIAARQASLSITNSRSLFKLMSIKSVMPCSHLILCQPLILLPPIPPSIRIFSNESTLRMSLVCFK